MNYGLGFTSINICIYIKIIDLTTDRIEINVILHLLDKQNFSIKYSFRV